MSDSQKVSSDWSAGLEIAATTQFQVLGGKAYIATGASAPTKDMAGNLIPDGRAVEIDSGATVYWRTDDTSNVYVSWLETGS